MSRIMVNNTENTPWKSLIAKLSPHTPNYQESANREPEPQQTQAFRQAYRSLLCGRLDTRFPRRLHPAAR